ncbi:MAG TPA: carbohydrate kinase family protein [Verrucomicrobiae bacterium]|nr:carbohydrate kinase family protein [Verrucomicrobiae bacterium]
MAQVHCLGVLVVDALSGPIEKYPVPGVTPQVNTTSIRFRAGGGAANTASALGQLGISVAVFSKVGADPNGVFLRSELKRNGVEVSNICQSDTESTPFTFVGIHPDGERSFIHTPGCNLSFSVKDLDFDRLYECDLLLYQDMWVLPQLDGPSAPQILAEAQKRGVTTLLDECYGLGPNRTVFEAALPYCDVVLPSYDDMRVVYPDLEAAAVAAHLRQCGARRVVLKLGARGCLVSAETGDVQLPSIAREIVDTTGAGDCFDAGFIAGMVNGLDDVAAARVGNATASACIRNVGGAEGIPSYQTLLGYHEH